ncbi:MAG TPA: glycosyltransferase family 87 protein [Ktedonobacterales bacterium]|nr:glycosyltransferase family 87 protein [Ktedonobacterales bacterium]
MLTQAAKMRTWSERLSPRMWRLLACCVCLAVLAVVLYRALHITDYFLRHSDFYSYYQAALDVRHGANPLAPVAGWIHGYQAPQRFVASYFVYAPFFALLLVPFTVLPFSAAFVLWGLCNTAFLFGAIYAVQRSTGIRFTLVSTLVLTTIAALLPPVRFELTWGQADIFLLFMLCAAIWARQEGHPILGGVLLAVACVTKPQLLLVVVILLWKRELKFAGAAIVAFPVMLLAPFLWLGGQALADQFTVWQFWSNVYVPFIDNMAPKGVLARLFTVNPSAHPFFVAPLLVTLGWLAIVAVVGLLTLAMVSSKPLRRDTLSMLELGLVVSAMLLISPLTEYIYLTLLVFSMVGVSILLSQVKWRSGAYRRVAIALFVFTVVICLPLQRIEYFFWPRMYTSSPLSALYILLGAPYLWVLVAYFVLHLYTLRLVTGQSPVRVVRAWGGSLAVLYRGIAQHDPRSRATAVVTSSGRQDARDI